MQHFTRFQLTVRSRGPSPTAGLLVFISEVAWKKDYLRRSVAFGFVATMQLLSNYFDLLSDCGRRRPTPLLSLVFTQAWRDKSIKTDDDHAAVTTRCWQ